MRSKTCLRCRRESIFKIERRSRLDMTTILIADERRKENEKEGKKRSVEKSVDQNFVSYSAPTKDDKSRRTRRCRVCNLNLHTCVHAGGIFIYPSLKGSLSRETPRRISLYYFHCLTKSDRTRRDELSARFLACCSRRRFSSDSRGTRKNKKTRFLTEAN